MIDKEGVEVMFKYVNVVQQSMTNIEMIVFSLFDQLLIIFDKHRSNSKLKRKENYCRLEIKRTILI